jgi:hypothetical protein
MTSRIFGSLRPIPSVPLTHEAANERIVRGAWLIARLVRQEPVRYKEFQERFGRPGRSFCCEVAALRAAGICRGSELFRIPSPKRNRKSAK